MAEWLVGMCERFHCLPSQLAAEDAEFMRQVSMVDMMRPDDDGSGDEL